MQDFPSSWVSWNPVTGCTRVSDGCLHCYAQRFAERWRGIPGHPYEHGFDLQLRPERLDKPAHWRKPRRVFVDSMSDLFHEQVPDGFIRDVFAVMSAVDRHVYHIITKRHERLAALGPSLPWPPHVFVGVTVEGPRYVHRADALRGVAAAVRFVCAEPLLGPLDHLDLTGIDWVVSGGESGPDRRPPQIEWVRGLRDLCAAADVPFTFKQWGGSSPGSGGRTVDGREWHEEPRRRAGETWRQPELWDETA